MRKDRKTTAAQTPAQGKCASNGKLARGSGSADGTLGKKVVSSCKIVVGSFSVSIDGREVTGGSIKHSTTRFADGEIVKTFLKNDIRGACSVSEVFQKLLGGV